MQNQWPPAYSLALKASWVNLLGALISVFANCLSQRLRSLIQNQRNAQAMEDYSGM